MKKNNIIITVLVAVVVGGASFFGGMQYQKSQPVTFGAGQFGNARFGQRNGAGAGRLGGGATIGAVVSADANSITIKMQDGSSKIVNVTSTTKIVKTESATTSDLTAGTQVAVFGTTNTDGSVNAQNVQINPMQRAFGSGRPDGSPAPTASK